MAPASASLALLPSVSGVASWTQPLPKKAPPAAPPMHLAASFPPPSPMHTGGLGASPAVQQPSPQALHQSAVPDQLLASLEEQKVMFNSVMQHTLKIEEKFQAMQENLTALATQRAMDTRLQENFMEALDNVREQFEAQMSLHSGLLQCKEDKFDSMLKSLTEQMKTMEDCNQELQRQSKEHQVEDLLKSLSEEIQRLKECHQVFQAKLSKQTETEQARHTKLEEMVQSLTGQMRFFEDYHKAHAQRSATLLHAQEQSQHNMQAMLQKLTDQVQAMEQTHQRETQESQTRTQGLHAAIQKMQREIQVLEEKEEDAKLSSSEDGALSSAWTQA